MMDFESHAVLVLYLITSIYHFPIGFTKDDLWKDITFFRNYFGLSDPSPEQFLPCSELSSLLSKLLVVRLDEGLEHSVIRVIFLILHHLVFRKTQGK